MEHEGFWVLVSDPEIRIQGIVIAEGVWRWIRQVCNATKETFTSSLIGWSPFWH